MVDFFDFTPAKTKATTIAADSQAGRIVAWLLTSGQTISPRQALERFGCTRLADCIGDLRRAGHRIADRRVRSGSETFTIYWISKMPPVTGQLFK